MNTLSRIRWLVWFVVLGGAASSVLHEDEPPVWQLRSSVECDLGGPRLDELFATAPSGVPRISLPALRPGAFQPAALTREQIAEVLQEHLPETPATRWTGPARILIVRRTQPLDEFEIKRRLTEVLQEKWVNERGELELRFSRPWVPIRVPTDPLTLKILDLPASGLAPNFIIRFELSDGSESLGQWQVPVQARIWQDVWVAAASTQRGQPLTLAPLTQERRDVLAMRDPVVVLPTSPDDYEMAEILRSGMPLSSRSFRLRPVIRRGKLADAVIADGSMTISVKVEALEDGVPGQVIRVRNLKSKREFRGKVQNEETISVSL